MSIFIHMGKVLWDNAWRIICLIVAFYALFWVGDRLYYRFAPASRFISNFEMQITSAVENTDIPVRVCRDFRGYYEGRAVRAIYRIPNDKEISERVFVDNVEVPRVVVDGPRCENGLFKAEQYKLKPGKYMFSTTLTFKVKHGEEKEISYESNVFTVLPQTPADIQERIDQLEEEIKQLRRLQRELNASGGSGGSGSGSSSQSPSGTSSNQNSRRKPDKKPDKPNNPPGPEDPEPSVIDRVIDLLPGL